MSFLLSPSGILHPKPFLAAAILLYAAGAASHVLTAPGVIATAGPWPFAAIQAGLIWLWFILHSQRLRDAGVAPGLAAAVALLYALSVVLRVIVEASFAGAISGLTGDAKAASGLELILLVSVIALLLGSAHYDFDVGGGGAPARRRIHTHRAGGRNDGLGGSRPSHETQSV